MKITFNSLEFLIKLSKNGTKSILLFFQLWMAHTMAVKGIFEIVTLKHPNISDAMPYTLDAYTVHMK